MCEALKRVVIKQKNVGRGMKKLWCTSHLSFVLICTGVFLIFISVWFNPDIQSLFFHPPAAHVSGKAIVPLPDEIFTDPTERFANLTIRLSSTTNYIEINSKMLLDLSLDVPLTYKGNLSVHIRPQNAICTNYSQTTGDVGQPDIFLVEFGKSSDHRTFHKVYSYVQYQVSGSPKFDVYINGSTVNSTNAILDIEATIPRIYIDTGLLSQQQKSDGRNLSLSLIVLSLTFMELAATVYSMSDKTKNNSLKNNDSQKTELCNPCILQCKSYSRC